MSHTCCRKEGKTVYVSTCQRFIIDTESCYSQFLSCVALYVTAYDVNPKVHVNYVSAMIQQPRAPSSGQMPASDVLIRAKEVCHAFSFIASIGKRMDGVSSSIEY